MRTRMVDYSARIRGALRETSLSSLIGYVSALLAVLLVTAIIATIRSHLSVTSPPILYLLAVLLSAIAFGRGPAVVASLASFLTYDWFFVQPNYTLTVSSLDEWVSLILLLITAVVTGQLAANQHRRAEEAVQREREALVLYDVIRLMGTPDLNDAVSAVTERLFREVDAAGVTIEVADHDGDTCRASAGDEEALTIIAQHAATSTLILGEGPAPTSRRRGAPGRWIRVVRPSPPTLPSVRRSTRSSRLYQVPIRYQERRVGDVFLVRPASSPALTSIDDRLLSAVSAQIGLTVERRRLRREATEAEILRRTDQLRTALLNAVSHDLRTPLASIIAAAGSLLQSDVEWTEEDRRQFAEAIEAEASRLNRIVGNLLDVSRIQSGSVHPRKGWYDLRSLVEDTLEHMRPILDGRQMVTAIPDDLPPVELDYVEIDQVLANLVENAVKYSPPGTPIAVTVDRLQNEVRVAVADSGPGVPPELSERIFEPFYRADRSEQRPRGTGLGLAVARGLVEAHGGRIWVEDRPKGGARFVFTLSLTTPPANPAREPHSSSGRRSSGHNEVGR